MNNQGNIFKKGLLTISRWDIYALVFLGFILILQIANWFRLPIFIDCYYHLSVVRAFHEAGGWVGTAFWEYAPVGRPHLYPPLFHILELALFRLGLEPIMIARFFDFLIFPLFLFVVWFCIRNLFSRELAFFSLFLLNASYPLYLAILSNIPFSLALIFFFLAFYCFKKSKFLSSVLYLGLSFYTHSLMSWFGLLAFVVYLVLDSENRKIGFRICLLALILALPMLGHELRFSHFIQRLKVLEYYYAQLNPLLYLLALIGAAVCFKKKGSYFFFVALIISMTPLLLTHRDRFLSGQGLVPLSLLAAVYLENFWEVLSRRFAAGAAPIIFWSGMTLAFYLATPLVILSPLKQGSEFLLDSSWGNHIGMVEKSYSSKAHTIYYKKFAKELVDIVKEISGDKDIFYSNTAYAAGMVFAAVPRATSNAMLSEVKPFHPLDEIGSARFILCFKDPSFELSPQLTQIIAQYKLKKIAETEIAYFYLNENSPFQKKTVPAKVPFWVCMVLLGGICVAFALDRPQVKKVDTT